MCRQQEITSNKGIATSNRGNSSSSSKSSEAKFQRLRKSLRVLKELDKAAC